jgi:hypothetical protein
MKTALEIRTKWIFWRFLLGGGGREGTIPKKGKLALLSFNNPSSRSGIEQPHFRATYKKKVTNMFRTSRKF